MKKWFAVAILAIFAFGFGRIASAQESARSNSPLSKVEEPTMPTMPKEAVPAEKKQVVVPEEKAASEEDAVIPDENTGDELMAPAMEDEVPAPGDEPKE